MLSGHEVISSGSIGVTLDDGLTPGNSECTEALDTRIEDCLASASTCGMAIDRAMVHPVENSYARLQLVRLRTDKVLLTCVE